MRFRIFLFAFIVCAVQPQIEAAGAVCVAKDDPIGCEVAYGSDDVSATSNHDVPSPIRWVPKPLELKELVAFDVETYTDVFGILKDENACSRFLGGPTRAIEAFNAFARRVRKKPLDNRVIAIRMSGRYGMFKNNVSGAEYRLFDEAAVNSNGPLTNRGQRRSDGRLAMVGSFNADTRAARALIFLHELGHLIPRSGGGWILPNDGGDFALSERNTNLVESKCRQQLSAIR